MTVRDIVAKYLKDKGYDGLVSPWPGDCGCILDALMPCNGDVDGCEPGYKVPCPGEDCELGGDCDWHISTKKPGEESP